MPNNIKSFVRAALAVMLVATCYFVLSPVATNAQSNLVTDPTSITGPGSTGSDFFAEIATTELSGFNNYLNAPRSFAKLSYDRAAGNQFRIGYCKSGTHSNCNPTGAYSSRSNLEVIVCALNAAESAIRANGCQIYVGPAELTNYTIAPSALAQQSTVNGRYNFIAIVQFRNNSPATANYPIHAFRLRAANNDGTAGFFAQQNLSRTDGVNQFVLGSDIDTPLAVQNRNADLNVVGATHRDSIRLQFRVDCDIPSGSSSFRLGWNDADATASSTPPNPDINWVIVQMRNGNAIDLRTVDTERGGQSKEQYLGGQDAARNPLLTGFNLQRGDVFIWEWQNVRANNGLQFKIPFDDANIIDACPAVTPATRGSCSINITSPSNGIIAPGQAITGTITVNNTGTANWDVRYGVTGFPPGRSFRIGSSDDSDRWGAGTTRMAIKASSGNLLQASTSTTTNPISFKAPEDITPGNESMFFRILEEGGSTNGRPIAACSADFEVKVNRPYIRVSGGDVLSGANFGSVYSGTCSNSASARTANIRTSGSYSDDPDLRIIQWYGYSSSQYAVFASGRIGSRTDDSSANSFNGSDGYFRTDENTRDLLFGNDSSVGTVASGERYGYFNSPSGLSVPCMNYSALSTSGRLSATDNVVSESDVRSSLTASGTNYLRYTGDVSIPASVITGKKVLYVEGTVTISGNINYASYTTPENMPYLMIIATDGIAIQVGNAPYITNIDAHLVSLPTLSPAGTAVNAKTGKIDTCSDRFGPAFVWPARNSVDGIRVGVCNRRLVINGSVVAKQILWKRPFGSIGSGEQVVTSDTCFPIDGLPGGTSAEGITAYVDGRLSTCAAEFINFSAESYLGSPIERNSTATIDSNPLVTTELPPIY